MLLKNTNDCKLFVEKQNCENPSELTKITFVREMWSEDEMIHTSNFSMLLTQEEITRLKETL